MGSPRYLMSFDTRQFAVEDTDVMVVGSGVAGLSTAIESARAGKRVLLVNKDILAESNTRYAQGGIATAIDGTPDSVASHIKDTIGAGDGLCDESVVRAVVEEGPSAIEFLQDCSCVFDRTSDGSLDVANEAAHSRARVLHAGGDATGNEISRGLIAAAKSEKNIRFYENCFIVDVLTTDLPSPRCIGALVSLEGELRVIYAAATVFATGGVGRLYRESSNPRIATGDGHAMAIRAGVSLRDLEMVQFHPTLIYVAGAPRVLVTEALRGAGAILRNSAGERFMEKYDSRGELAPRDILCRAIVAEMRERREAAVFLDVTHFSQQEVARFPGFAALCEDYDIDVSKSWVPVRPGPHYMIGGISTDLDGRTSLESLFAVGEASASGLHGANRLASNSLLEGVVLGRRLGKALAGSDSEILREDIVYQRSGPQRRTESVDYYDLRSSFRALMWRSMGVERDAEGLRELIGRIEGWHRLWMGINLNIPQQWALANMLELGYAMAKSALHREESRGAHYRRDFSTHDDDFSTRHVEYDRTQGLSWGS